MDENPAPTAVTPKTRKFLLPAILIALFVLVVGFLVFKNFSSKSKENVSTPPSSTNTLVDHPNLFSAYLEYNPNTQEVKQLSTGKANGDIPVLNPNQPPASPDDFVYQIELISQKNELLQKGWVLLPKSAIKTRDGLLRFHVYTLNKPGAIVQVSLPDGKKIWTGKIP